MLDTTFTYDIETVPRKNLTKDMLFNADEAFFTGTAAEVTPIRKLDDKKVGDGKRGPVTKKLQELYFNVVHGKNMQYMKWLNFIE